jgi:4-alpha-glucanotransferase
LQTARDRLLTPYGLRSLIPRSCYRGRYEGDLRQRDLSVHQGTIWSGLWAVFAKWERFYGATAPIDLQPLRTISARKLDWVAFRIV